MLRWLQNEKIDNRASELRETVGGRFLQITAFTQSRSEESIYIVL